MSNGEEEFIFASSSMEKILKDMELSDGMNILIEGETGVGKTPIAKYANRIASRLYGKTRPFIRINCAGLSRERLQADLFGHTKGAFTGAVSENIGLVELANGGDLFMDEVADMDLQCQAELLTFLDSGEYRRVGDPKLRRSTCRIISASNSDLKQKTEKGFFRKDLYSRLSQYKIKIPPLRKRKEDIKPLMEYYIKKFCGYLKPYTNAVIESFTNYSWIEGNVRELRDSVKYMVNRANSFSIIDALHINFNNAIIGIEPDSFIYAGEIKGKAMELGYETYMDNIERTILCELLSKEKSVRALSKKLKMCNMTLARKLKKYKISIN